METKKGVMKNEKPNMPNFKPLAKGKEAAFRRFFEEQGAKLNHRPPWQSKEELERGMVFYKELMKPFPAGGPTT